MKKANLLFLGERKISEQCLKLLCEPEFSEHFCLKAVVTNEAFYRNMVKDISLPSSIKFIGNDSRNTAEILTTIKEHDISLLISVQHIWILPEEILDAVGGRAFNLHNAKLPDYKGFNSISHAILAEETEFVSTIHWMAPEVDSGDIIVEGCTDIKTNDTALTLYKRAVKTAVASFRTFLGHLISEQIPRKKMAVGGYFYKRNDLDKEKQLSLDLTHEEVLHRARACFFPPHEPAFFVVDEQKFYVVPSSDEGNSWQNQRPFNKSEWEL